MDEIKDYAYPTMMAEHALKELHKAMLNRDLESAKMHGLEAGMQVMKILKIINTQKHEG